MGINDLSMNSALIGMDLLARDEIHQKKKMKKEKTDAKEYVLLFQIKIDVFFL